VSYVMASAAVSPIPEHEGEDGMDSSYMPRSSHTPTTGAGGGKYENAMASLGVATEERNNAMKEANKLRQELSTAMQQVELLQVTTQWDDRRRTEHARHPHAGALTATATVAHDDHERPCLARGCAKRCNPVGFWFHNSRVAATGGV
jgi:hypothetical protein